MSIAVALFSSFELIVDWSNDMHDIANNNDFQIGSSAFKLFCIRVFVYAISEYTRCFVKCWHTSVLRRSYIFKYIFGVISILFVFFFFRPCFFENDLDASRKHCACLHFCKHISSLTVLIRLAMLES